MTGNFGPSLHLVHAPVETCDIAPAVILGEVRERANNAVRVMQRTADGARVPDPLLPHALRRTPQDPATDVGGQAHVVHARSMLCTVMGVRALISRYTK